MSQLFAERKVFPMRIADRIGFFEVERSLFIDKLLIRLDANNFCQKHIVRTEFFYLGYFAFNIQRALDQDRGGDHAPLLWRQL